MIIRNPNDKALSKITLSDTFLSKIKTKSPLDILGYKTMLGVVQGVLVGFFICLPELGTDLLYF